MIVDPLGSVLTDLGDKIGLEVVEINKQRINQVRDILPLLRNRREDVYRISQSD
jgi:predicted amidohydrolase